MAISERRENDCYFENWQRLEQEREREQEREKEREKELWQAQELEREREQEQWQAQELDQEQEQELLVQRHNHRKEHMPKTLTISDETWEKIKDQIDSETDFEVDGLDDFIGKKVFIRTVTYHLTGKIVKRIGQLWELEDAAWIADSGRFMKAIKDGELEEVEPVGKCWVNTQTIVDVFPWNHKLPQEQK